MKMVLSEDPEKIVCGVAPLGGHASRHFTAPWWWPLAAISSPRSDHVFTWKSAPPVNITVPTFEPCSSAMAWIPFGCASL